MPFTKRQRQTLSARVLVDRKFREEFLADPQKAAWSLGILLSGPEAAQVAATKKALEDIGKALDGVLDTKVTKEGEVESKILPMISIGDRSTGDVAEG